MNLLLSTVGAQAFVRAGWGLASGRDSYRAADGAWGDAHCTRVCGRSSGADRSVPTNKGRENKLERSRAQQRRRKMAQSAASQCMQPVTVYIHSPAAPIRSWHLYVVHVLLAICCCDIDWA